MSDKAFRFFSAVVGVALIGFFAIGFMLGWLYRGMTRTIHCRFCDQALPLSVEDRESWPILVDMLVQCHETRCDRYLSLAGDVLADETTVWLRGVRHG